MKAEAETSDNHEESTNASEATEDSQMDEPSTIPDDGKPATVQADLTRVKANPTEAPQVAFQALQAAADAIYPNGLFTIFFITWLPFMLTGAGSVLGSLINLILRGSHFVAGAAGAYYIYGILRQPKTANVVKLTTAIPLAAFIPAVMIDNSGNFLTDVFMLVAAAGGPYVLEQWMADAVRSALKSTGEEAQLGAVFKVNIAAVVTFVVSSGGYGWINSILLGLVFALASLGTQKVYPMVAPQLEPFVPPQFRSHSEIIFVAIELVLAKVVLYILYGLILPADLFATQNGMLLDILFTLIGFGVLAAGVVIQVMDDKKLGLGYTGAVLGSFVFLLLGHIFHEALSFRSAVAGSPVSIEIE